MLRSLQKTRSIGFVLLVCFLGNSSAFSVPSALPLSRISGTCVQAQRRPAASKTAGAAALRAIAWPWESQAAKPQDNKVQREAKREELLQLCRSAPKNGVGTSEPLRESIQKACSELARLNPTKKQASSPILNGRWGLVYTSTAGASAGKLGPFVGEVEQDIDLKSQSYANIVRVIGGLVEARLSAHWEIPAEDKWTVIFDDIQFKLFGIPVVKRQFAKESRDEVLTALDKAAQGSGGGNPQRNQGTWVMSYMDENLRVLYAQGSDPSQPSNVYILSRILN